MIYCWDCDHIGPENEKGNCSHCGSENIQEEYEGLGLPDDTLLSGNLFDDEF